MKTAGTSPGSCQETTLTQEAQKTNEQIGHERFS